jgi:hypothetical protein
MSSSSVPDLPDGHCFHKTSTRDYHLKTVASWGFEARVVAEEYSGNLQVVDFIQVAIGGDETDEEEDAADEMEKEAGEVEKGDKY